MACQRFWFVFCRRPHLLLKYSVALMLKLRLHRLALMASSKLVAADKYANELCFDCTTLVLG